MMISDDVLLLCSIQGQFQQGGILYRCTFDNQESCNLQQQVSGDDFDWIIGYGQLFRPRGPSADHSQSTARGTNLIAQLFKKNDMMNVVIINYFSWALDSLDKFYFNRRLCLC